MGRTVVQTPIQTDKPVFIGAVGRSGTTLLGNILNCHPQLAIFHESDLIGLFQQFYQYFDLRTDSTLLAVLDHLFALKLGQTDHLRFPELQPVIEPIKQAALASDRRPETLFTLTMSHWAQSQGKSRWGDKHGHYIQRMPQLHLSYPYAKFITIVRDPRAVASSMLKLNYDQKTEVTIQGLPVHRIADVWIRAMRQWNRHKRMLPPEQVFELRYEDLIQDPERQIAALCTFLGEPFDPAMLQFHEHLPERYQARKETFPGLHANLGNPINTDSQDKWKTDLSAEQIRVIEAITGPMLDYYHYERHTAAPPLSLGQQLFLLGYRWSDPIRRALRKQKWLRSVDTQMHALQKTLF